MNSFFRVATSLVSAELRRKPRTKCEKNINAFLSKRDNFLHLTNRTIAIIRDFKVNYGARNRFLQYHALRKSKAASVKRLQQKKFGAFCSWIRSQKRANCVRSILDYHLYIAVIFTKTYDWSFLGISVWWHKLIVVALLLHDIVLFGSAPQITAVFKNYIY
jgi:hypothetical protein